MNYNSVMTLDEAIKHCREVADKKCDDCGKEHLQLAEWLEELKENRETINRQNAEIERLEKANKSFSCLGKLYSEIKFEVRKEFAERLKEKSEHFELEKENFVSEADIDRTLAEMENNE